MKGIIGKKIGMTQVIDEKDGKVTPVTVIQAGPCFVTQVRTAERDGYTAVQIGYEEVPTYNHKDAKGQEEVRSKKISKGEFGHLQRHNLPALKHLREFRVKEADVKEGDKLTVDVFAKGDHVDVVGVSKGRGFAGGIRRHHFNRQPTTHGASDRTRAPGSSGATTTPGRVYKGTRRPGRMGNDRVTTQNLEVIVVDAENHLLAVKGSVPGAKGGLVIVKMSVKA
ncbi:MAG: 50S ribosomal protein L3 [Aggregatilineales bacterium]